jgi:hypothetical protein
VTRNCAVVTVRAVGYVGLVHREFPLSEPVVVFVALAIDYDGTLARNGRVDAATTDALREVKKSGRKLIPIRAIMPPNGAAGALGVAEKSRRLLIGASQWSSRNCFRLGWFCA